MSLSVLCTNLQLWEAVSGKCVATLVGHKEEVLDVCFDLSGQLIATASADGECKVCHATQSAHMNSVLTLTFLYV